MNIDDLEWQSRGLGGYPPVLVDLLMEQGDVELLVRAASRGAWSCARAAARQLCKTAEFERALGVLEPFVELGWEPARWAAADIVLQSGRVQQALERVRPDDVGSASEHVCRDFAELLVKAGQVDEAITVLTPHLDRGWLLSVLVELTEGQNRDERVLELLAPKAERARNARGEERWNLEASNAQDLQAQVLERAGLVDEAVRVLGADIAADRFLVQNTLTAYAELLQRNDRMEELRELGTGEHAHVGLPYYARALEDRGRTDEAETVLRRFIAADEWGRFRWPLIELLGRQGRLEEAVEVGRPTFDHHDACLLESVIHLLAEAGCFDEALTILDERDADFIDEHPSWFHTNRIGLLGEAGRYEEALAHAKTLPTDLYGLTSSTAWILEQSGRVEEALDLLRADADVEAWEAAALLVRHGRADEAIDSMPSIADLRAASRWG
ncbi:hypothetical protein [Streptomyces sp. ML-6]|uniref:hypothetical protein n=1 Tax=Streptomyces sp. ML-6 TaxID=2982693 RepID=UPI0024BFC964|nr:hypothetical protein [Streptomyces sp. ML-6]MDK0517843.1 hypothetical protein [Streptomyces sp. ML-6]